MIYVVWKMLFNKGCGWNETHTSKYHNEHQQLLATFKVHHTIHVGFFQKNLTLLPQLPQEC